METTMTKETVAKEMAKYFNETITVAELLEWVAYITYKISDTKDLDDELKGETVFFISYVLPNFAASLIKCKTENERKETLEQEILSVFAGMDYQWSKKALKLIGDVFISSYLRVTANDPEEITAFYKTFTVLLNLCELFRRYKYFENDEQESKAA